MPRTSSKPADDISSIVPSTTKDGAAELTQAAVEHREDLLDEALEESFPASDPVGPQSVD